jgi:hypothetical protein
MDDAADDPPVILAPLACRPVRQMSSDQFPLLI